MPKKVIAPKPKAVKPKLVKRLDPLDYTKVIWVEEKVE